MCSSIITNSTLDNIIAEDVNPTILLNQLDTVITHSSSHFSLITEATISQSSYPHTADLLKLDSCQCTPTNLPAIPHIEAIVSPLIPDAWERALASHPDRKLATYILAGLRQGFRIGFNQQSPLASAKENMPSTKQNPQVVADYLQTEMCEKRVIGPLPIAWHDRVHTNRFGVIPKRHQPGKWRLILDLLFPHNASVNMGIDKDLCSLQYVTVDHAARIISEMGPGTELAKIDIAHAYRNVPVHPQDRPLLAMQWQGQLFIDTVLPFGLRSAPKIFCAISDTLEWVLHQRGLSAVLHYIDDFITFGAVDSQQCLKNLDGLLAVCGELGIPLQATKIEGPDTIITFLGIEFNTRTMEMKLPEDKKARLHDLIRVWLDCKRAASKRELLSLIGELAHACKVVSPGRIFLRRLIDLSCTRPNINDWIRLNQEAKADLKWWDLFLDKWNGMSLLKSHVTRVPEAHIFTDASGGWGCGAYWDSRWFKAPWSSSWQSVNIATKEMVPVILSLAVWGEQLSSLHVQIHSDNMAVVEVIKAKSSKDSMVMHLLRCMHFFTARHDITVSAVHVPGVNNSRADALSRDNIESFLQITPEAQSQPTAVPQQLWSVVVEQQIDWLSPAWSSKLGTL